jgi:hypothetical protein
MYHWHHDVGKEKREITVVTVGPLQILCYIVLVFETSVYLLQFDLGHRSQVLRVQDRDLFGYI